MKKKLSLEGEWKRRLELLDHHDRCRDKSNAGFLTCKSRCAGRRKCSSEEHKRDAESYIWYGRSITAVAEANLFWAEAILAKHGSITVEWLDDGGCELGNGEVYKAPKRKRA